MDHQQSSASPGPGGWRYHGQQRPPFAAAPGPGEESVWDYPRPGFEDVLECVSFYPGRIACYMDQVRVHAQPGGFYGGWITPEVVGPFKGGIGTTGW